jgi:hypothetical protein
MQVVEDSGAGLTPQDPIQDYAGWRVSQVVLRWRTIDPDVRVVVGTDDSLPRPPVLRRSRTIEPLSAPIRAPRTSPARGAQLPRRPERACSGNGSERIVYCVEGIS